MRDYGIVSPKFWIGETGKRLRGDPTAQLIAAYLITSPHSTMTGVFYCPLLYISEETGCPIKGASKGLRRLIDEAFCEYDTASDTVFVLRMAAFQIGESLSPKDTRVVGLKRDLEKMTSRPLKQRFLQLYGTAYHLISGDWMPEPHQSPLDAPSMPHRCQDQDQDQDQKQDQEQEQKLRGVAKATARGSRLPDGWLPEEATITSMMAEFPNVNFTRETASFVDYWHAKAGADASKLDWNATFRNWIRRSAERQPNGNGGGQTKFARTMEALKRA